MLNEFEAENKSDKSRLKESENTIDSLTSELILLRKESLKQSKDKVKHDLQVKKKKNPPRLLKIISQVVEAKNMIVGVFLTLIDKNSIGMIDTEEFLRRMKIYYHGIKRKDVEEVKELIGCKGSMIKIGVVNSLIYSLMPPSFIA